jgi:predicted nucleic acid-binding Zn ribbon protein
MKEYEFTCSECGQQIDVNDEMKRAILANGCPVCTAAADEDEFDG